MKLSLKHALTTAASPVMLNLFQHLISASSFVLKIPGFLGMTALTASSDFSKGISIGFYILWGKPTIRAGNNYFVQKKGVPKDALFTTLPPDKFISSGSFS